MRHHNGIKKIGRTASHRKATLASLSHALIEHKQITTTISKARALRRFVEPVLTRAKEDTMHNRREAFRYLNDKHAVKELFDTIGPAIGDRPGGYTRIIKLGLRPGDATEVAMIELVDFGAEAPGGGTKKKTRRTRRSRSGSSSTPAADAA